MANKKISLVSTPKEKFNPIYDNNQNLLKLTDIATALEEIAPQSILYTAVPKPKIDFVRELITKPTEKPLHIASIDDTIIINVQLYYKSFTMNLTANMTSENIQKIIITQGQSSNETWYHFPKSVITASKCHGVFTKMVKVNKGSNVDMWSLHQKVSELVFVNPDIPALKYGWVMEDNAVTCFFDFMKKKHKHFQLHECGLYLNQGAPYIGGSADRIVTCSCCNPACLEVKCPYSSNHLPLFDPEAKLPYLVEHDGKSILSRMHRYHSMSHSDGSYKYGTLIFHGLDSSWYSN